MSKIYSDLSFAGSSLIGTFSVNDGSFGITNINNGSTFVMSNSGYIGIGKSSPTSKLEVNGNVLFDNTIDNGFGGNSTLLNIKSRGAASDSVILLENSAYGNSIEINSSVNYSSIEMKTLNGGFFSIKDDVNPVQPFNYKLRLGVDANGEHLRVKDNLYISKLDRSVDFITIINSTANVGIGTITPTSKLHIIASGSQSLTNSLNVDNSSGFRILEVRDDGQTTFQSSDHPNRKLLTKFGDYDGLVLKTDGPYQGYILDNTIYDGTDARWESTRLSNGGSGWQNSMYMTSNGYSWVVDGSGGYSWSINLLNPMKITNAGNVGINTTSPSGKLEVVSSTSSGSYTLKVVGTTSNPLLYVRNDGVDSAYFHDTGKIYMGASNIGKSTGSSGVNINAIGQANWVFGWNNGELKGYGTFDSGCAIQISSTTTTVFQRFDPQPLNNAYFDVGVFANDFKIQGVLGTDSVSTSIITIPQSGSNRGNVGIGTTTPSYKLDTGLSGVQGRIGTMLIGDWPISLPSISGYGFIGTSYLDQTGAGGNYNYALIQYSTGETCINAPTNKFISFRLNNTEIGKLKKGETYGGDPYLSLGENTAGTNILTFYNSGSSSRIGVGLGTSTIQNYMTSGNSITWNTGGDLQTEGTNELMRLVASTGNLGIGTSNPLSKLSVTGDLYVTGAGTFSNLYTKWIDFERVNQTPSPGRLSWDTDFNSLYLGLTGGNVNLVMGQDTVQQVFNGELTTLLKGEVVYISGAQGDKIKVKRASNLSDTTSSKTLGVVAENIPSSGIGYVTSTGVVTGLNLSGYNSGDILWLGATAGTYDVYKPQAPNHLVFVGVVLRNNPGNGLLYVKPQNGYELDEIHNVLISGTANGDLLAYESSTGLWKNKTAQSLNIATIDSYYSATASTSFTWDVGLTSSNYKITLTGSATVNLNNVNDGDYGTLILIQDSSGGHTITLGTLNGGAVTHKVVGGGGGSITLTGTANSVDIITFTYDGQYVYWNAGLNYT